MNFDVERHLGAVERSVSSLEREGQPARAVVLSRRFPTGVTDLWDAVTNSQRIPRWFLPVNGRLEAGGRYQLEGNAAREGAHGPNRPPAHAWGAGMEELIRRTRDQKKYPLVFKGLVEYGFRRNLLGLKTFGVLIALASLAGTGWSTYTSWSAATPPAVSIVAGIITAGLLLAWMTWVTERTVKLAANRYAHFILEAALDQE